MFVRGCLLLSFIIIVCIMPSSYDVRDIFLNHFDERPFFISIIFYICTLFLAPCPCPCVRAPLLYTPRSIERQKREETRDARASYLPPLAISRPRRLPTRPAAAMLPPWARLVGPAVCCARATHTCFSCARAKAQAQRRVQRSRCVNFVQWDPSHRVPRDVAQRPGTYPFALLGTLRVARARVFGSLSRVWACATRVDLRKVDPSSIRRHGWPCKGRTCKHLQGPPRATRDGRQCVCEHPLPLPPMGFRCEPPRGRRAAAAVAFSVEHSLALARASTLCWVPRCLHAVFIRAGHVSCGA